MMIRWLLIITAFAAFSSLTSAQNPAGVSGQFDFSRIPGISNSPTVEINLNAQMLRFVSVAARAADPNAGDILGGIESVRLLVYEDGENGQALLNYVDEVSIALEKDDWQRAVYVQEEDESVRIYVKFDETRLAGLTLLIAESGGEAVFANFAGNIDPTKLGSIARTLGMGDFIGDIAGIIGEVTTNPAAAQD